MKKTSREVSTTSSYNLFSVLKDLFTRGHRYDSNVLDILLRSIARWCHEKTSSSFLETRHWCWYRLFDGSCIFAISGMCEATFIKLYTYAYICVSSLEMMQDNCSQSCIHHLVLNYLRDHMLMHVPSTHLITQNQCSRI